MYKYVYYLANDGWRWRFVAPNGKIISDGAEWYATEYGVKKAIGNVIKRNKGAVAVLRDV